ncbi:beta-1,4-mannosyl-glycoprotein beta-1,4-N-acetylglucosaminyltransferase [Entomortierella parvispora]|uniref:Beta-1,4-mannosyl-glycoprotein beta-1,4-N-acetylglucosaminyltransferase n=1 Tax=Entomortierella parvispora TaxID=205924 RepID=A0A9P3LZ10_9FUNG|nr:beta-1,4-mannosyl-glycoprotein beta-1,4-N-acetylglucosaminyltransferase [Entomortierella parvispora]
MGLLMAISLLLLVQERHDIVFNLKDLTSHHDALVANTTSTTIGPKGPQIYDVILFNSEFNMLEIRLNELSPFVDWFVIIESEMTFSGQQKPLNYRLKEPQFEKFRRQILHVVVPASALEVKTWTWGRETETRNLGFWMMLDIHRPQEGDWLMISDLDELPRRSILKEMKDQNPQSEMGRLFGDGTPGSGGDLFRFGCQFHYYSYEYRHTGGLWVGPVAIRYHPSSYWLDDAQSKHPQVDTMRKVSAKDWREAGDSLRALRISENATYVDDSCLHCTWCFSNITQIISKVEAYSHQEHNNEKYKTRQWILDAIKEGRDLFERPVDQFVYVPDNNDIPVYVSENREKYSYMLSRHNKSNAGFLDVNPEDPLDENWKPTTLQ